MTSMPPAKQDPSSPSASVEISDSVSSSGVQGHPLADLLRTLAASVDLITRSRASSGDEQRLDALRQDAVWVSLVLEAWRVAARVSSGDRPMKPTPLDLQRAARDRVEALSGPAALRGTQLYVEAQPVNEAMGDPALTEQLLGGLLAASVLTSPEGSALSVELDDAEGLVSCRIRSTGKSPEVDYAPGDGAPDVLGRLAEWLEPLLPLAEAQGGVVEVESQTDGGFTFLFSLPRVEATEGLVEGTVLIIDDDPDGAFLLEQVLLKAGFHVRIAGNGIEGLSLARQKGTAVILLDVMLPGLDGFEVCHRLRDDPASAKTPIIMISAKSRPEDRDMGFKVGADAYMTKPLGMNDVVQAVTHFMQITEEGSHD
jgi:CheY-like chemotaxis protein